MNRAAAYLALVFAAACVDQPVLDSSEQGLCYSDDPLDCRPPPPPYTAPDAFVTGRTTTSLTVKFTSSAGNTSSLLQHRTPGAAWANLASYGSGTAGLQSKSHGALASDSIHCYRVYATNGTAFAYGKEVCGLTQTPNDIAVNRLQLHVVVAGASDAGTADRVSVSLSDETKLPGYNFTGLNYGPVLNNGSYEDFQRSRDFTYDLNLGTSFMNPDRSTGWGRIQTLHDIAKISLKKIGTDALCLAKLELLVNGKVALAKTYGNTSTTCKWLANPVDQAESLVIPFGELRATPSFTGFVSPLPPVQACTDGICTTIQRTELESRLEGMIGSTIWASGDVYWGQVSNRAVEISRVGSHQLHVDLDLAASIDWVDDPEVDVDFDIDLAFAPGANGGWDLQFNVSHFAVDVDFDLWTDFLGVLFAPVCASVDAIDSWNCTGTIENMISDAAEGAFAVKSQRIPFLGPNQCTNQPTLAVNVDGSITVGCIPRL